MEVQGSRVGRRSGCAALARELEKDYRHPCPVAIRSGTTVNKHVACSMEVDGFRQTHGAEASWPGAEPRELADRFPAITRRSSRYAPPAHYLFGRIEPDGELIQRRTARQWRQNSA